MGRLDQGLLSTNPIIDWLQRWEATGICELIKNQWPYIYSEIISRRSPIIHYLNLHNWMRSNAYISNAVSPHKDIGTQLLLIGLLLVATQGNQFPSDVRKESSRDGGDSSTVIFEKF